MKNISKPTLNYPPLSSMIASSTYRVPAWAKPRTPSLFVECACVFLQKLSSSKAGLDSRLLRYQPSGGGKNRSSRPALAHSKFKATMVVRQTKDLWAGVSASGWLSGNQPLSCFLRIPLLESTYKRPSCYLSLTVLRENSAKVTNQSCFTCRTRLFWKNNNNNNSEALTSFSLSFPLE